MLANIIYLVISASLQIKFWKFYTLDYLGPTSYATYMQV